MSRMSAMALAVHVPKPKMCNAAAKIAAELGYSLGTRLQLQKKPMWYLLHAHGRG